MARTQLTEIDWLIFKDEFDKWVKFFGLNDWEITHRFEDDGEDYRAKVWVIEESMICTVYLNPIWTTEVTEAELKSTAFHEVCEAMLSLLNWAGLKTDLPKDEKISLMNRERHAIIQRLVNSVWKNDRRTENPDAD